MNKGYTRRDFIKTVTFGLGSALSGALSSTLGGCATICSAPISWSPTVLAPVFYGYEDYAPSDGVPADLRVFFPSIDGSPQIASLLTCRGSYPLVLFLHGQCDESDHYTRWTLLPATLARSGFVVVVPDLGWGGGQYPWASNSAQYTTALDVIDWMHASWSGRSWLSSSSTLAIVGHSFGALLGGRLSVDIDNSAYVSIGGGWAEWPASPVIPIPSLSVASLFLYGTADTFAAQPALLGTAPSPTHRVIFDGGLHWDHLDSVNPTCDSQVGSCNLVHSLTADLTTLFLSKILRVATIPDSLEPPEFTLSADQTFYAGAHLTSLDLLPQSSCGVTIEWNTSVAGSVSLPWP